MLKKAKKVIERREYIFYIQYARFADGIVILVNYYYRWLVRAVYKQTVQEFNKLGVKVNRDKTKKVDLTRGKSFRFLGFLYRRARTLRGKWGVSIVCQR
jgi:RNA-directed DNA polymerase